MTTLAQPKELNDGQILLNVAQAMQNRVFQVTHYSAGEFNALTDAVWERAFLFIIRHKIHTGQLKMIDLENKRVFELTERYLGKQYPHLNLRDNPANQLLHDGCYAQEVSASIATLIQASNGKVPSSEVWVNRETEAILQQELAQEYPHLNLDLDPGPGLLSGKWRAEVEHKIAQLIAERLKEENSYPNNQ